MSKRLRISGGRFRGQLLHTGSDSVLRPTTERVREALFSMLQSRLELDGSRILDLYAGSGVFAFEALSRGASSAVCVEQKPQIARQLLENAERLDLERVLECRRQAVSSFLARPGTDAFDVVFADPPYTHAEPVGLLKKLLESLCFASQAVVIQEGPRELSPDALAQMSVLLKNAGLIELELFQRSFGSSVLVLALFSKGK